ncbi:MAG: hypothetical protein V3R73_02135 [Sphingomonadales bacterium]
MIRRNFLKAACGLGGLAVLSPRLAFGAYTGSNREAYENWVLLCMRIDRSRDYYAGLYNRALRTIAGSGLPYERLDSTVNSEMVDGSTEFYYGQPSARYSQKLYMEGKDPSGYLVAASLKGWIAKPHALSWKDTAGDKYFVDWSVEGHVAATRNGVGPNSTSDFYYSPGYLAAPAGLDHSAEDASHSHKIMIDEMLVVPAASLRELADPQGYLDLFRAMAKTPPMSLLPPAGILRSTAMS